MFCDHKYDIAVCPRCGKAGEHKYDSKARSVRHLDLFEMKTVLHFESRRFECLTCGLPFTENLSRIRSQRRHTVAFEHYIYEQVQRSSRLDVAIETGLCEATVLDIFKYWAKQAIRDRATASTQIPGPDELSIQKGHGRYVLILIDLARRCVLEVLPDRKKETLEKWLDEKLTEAERKAIKIVSMDMWKPYREAVRHKLPHAKIVADRFHVMKQLGQQIDNIRRRIQKNAAGELARILKNSRWVLFKDPDDLTADEKLKLTQIQAASDELRTIYLLKEEFRTLCNKIQDKARAERFLRAWIFKPGRRAAAF